MKLIADSWTDGDLRARALANPEEVLDEYGIERPAGKTIKLISDSEQLLHLRLPARPSSEELTVEELETVAGGVARSSTPALSDGKVFGSIGQCTSAAFYSTI